MLITCPYAFDDRPEARFTSAELRSKLVAYDLLVEEDGLIWRLAVGPRRAIEYSCEPLHLVKRPRQSPSNPS